MKNGLPIWDDRIQLVVNGQPVENAKLPYVRVPDIRSLTPDAFQVVADIVDAPELPLVLPTRKDVVRTPFLTDELLPAAERALYRTLSRMPTDGRDETILAFTAGHRATVARLNRELPEAERITLPEPPRQLFPWNPTPSVTRSTGVTRPVPANPDQGPPVALVGPDSLEPLVAQALRGATERDGGKTPLLWADYAGFDDLDWHRALPRVTRVDVEVAFADATVAWNAAKPAPPAFVDRDDRRPERITFTVHSRSDDPDGIREHEPVKLDADWIAVSEDTSEDWMRARFTDEAALFIRKGAALRKDKLVEALTEAIGDDEDEQHRWYVYQEEWEAEIDRITLGDDEAKLVLMKRITREHLLPLTPTNTRTTIVIERGKGIDVTVTPTGDQAAV